MLPSELLKSELAFLPGVRSCGKAYAFETRWSLSPRLRYRSFVMSSASEKTFVRLPSSDVGEGFQFNPGALKMQKYFELPSV